MAAADRSAAGQLAPRLEILIAHDEPGAALRAWAATATVHDREYVYLAGHAQSLQQLRVLLRARGVARDRIVTKAYWATGRAGL